MVITDIEQVTPASLTRLLNDKGYSVEVETVKVVKSRKTVVSSHYHLVVQYRQNDAHLSHRLFLKLPVPQFGWERHEVDFYRRIVPAMTIKAKFADLPFVHCYDIAHNQQTMESHLLMEDLSASYFGVNGGETPTRAHYESIVDGFAKLHAFWWEHPHLGRGVGERLSHSQIDHMIEMAQYKFSEISGDRSWLMPEMETVVSKWPERRRERVINGHGITLVHRDPHPHNFLYARYGHAVKLIDWESWRVDTGTDDLAYMMACHWDWAQRSQLERDLLKRYHDRLVEYGVSDYTFDDVLYDYRASIVRCLFFLMIAWSSSQFERIGRGVNAFDEWRCAEIL